MKKVRSSGVRRDCPQRLNCTERSLSSAKMASSRPGAAGLLAIPLRTQESASAARPSSVSEGVAGLLATGPADPWVGIGRQAAQQPPWDVPVPSYLGAYPRLGIVC